MSGDLIDGMCEKKYSLDSEGGERMVYVRVQGHDDGHEYEYRRLIYF